MADGVEAQSISPASSPLVKLKPFAIGLLLASLVVWFSRAVSFHKTHQENVVYHQDFPVSSWHRASNELFEPNSNVRSSRSRAQLQVRSSSQDRSSSARNGDELEPE
ncbi:hypothetical protein EJB05_00013, partial [Eragrostis curvula]